jgi:hypothetical protein
MTSIAWTMPRNQDAADWDAERNLVERAKRDPVALSELYRQHYPAIHRFIHRRVLDPHVREVQPPLADAFRLPSPYIRCEPTWLHPPCRNPAAKILGIQYNPCGQVSRVKTR